MTRNRFQLKVQILVEVECCIPPKNVKNWLIICWYVRISWKGVYNSQRYICIYWQWNTLNAKQHALFRWTDIQKENNISRSSVTLWAMSKTETKAIFSQQKQDDCCLVAYKAPLYSWWTCIKTQLNLTLVPK